jgi:hypothetical protein
MNLFLICQKLIENYDRLFISRVECERHILFKTNCSLSIKGACFIIYRPCLLIQKIYQWNVNMGLDPACYVVICVVSTIFVYVICTIRLFIMEFFNEISFLCFSGILFCHLKDMFFMQWSGEVWLGSEYSNLGLQAEQSRFAGNVRRWAGATVWWTHQSFLDYNKSCDGKFCFSSDMFLAFASFVAYILVLHWFFNRKYKFMVDLYGLLYSL